MSKSSLCAGGIYAVEMNVSSFLQTKEKRKINAALTLDFWYPAFHTGQTPVWAVL